MHLKPSIKECTMFSSETRKNWDYSEKRNLELDYVNKTCNLKHKNMNKITIIGSGNIGLSLARGLVNKEYCPAKNITLTRRNVQQMTSEIAQGFQVSDQNYQAVLDASIIVLAVLPQQLNTVRSEEHTSELQPLMRISYAVFCLKKKRQEKRQHNHTDQNYTHVHEHTV